MILISSHPLCDQKSLFAHIAAGNTGKPYHTSRWFSLTIISAFSHGLCLIFISTQVLALIFRKATPSSNPTKSSSAKSDPVPSESESLWPDTQKQLPYDICFHPLFSKDFQTCSSIALRWMLEAMSWLLRLGGRAPAWGKAGTGKLARKSLPTTTEAIIAVQIKQGCYLNHFFVTLQDHWSSTAIPLAVQSGVW